jgi:hypothetical protein
MLSIKEFCELNFACKEDRKWASANCRTMIDVWDTARPEWLVWVATRPGVLDDRTLRLFAVHCARSVQHLLTDQRSRDAIDVAERFASGDATADELSAAWDAAWSVADEAREAAWSVAWAAAREAARSVAWSVADKASYAAREAAEHSTWSAAWGAACDAARSVVDTAIDTSRDAARDAQAEWLRRNARPTFSISIN